MSRIDEALRRAGTEAPRPAPAGGETVFVSPWSVEGPGRSTAPDRRVPGHSGEPSAVAGGRPLVSFNGAWRERLVTALEPNPVLVEQVRRLAGTLHHAQNANGIRVIMLTSASPEDGKTLTAINLALVLSESYRRRVLLIDADLRRPSLGGIAGVAHEPGLGDALKASADQKLRVLSMSPTLELLPAGSPNPDPMGSLTSARMREIVEEASARFDWVILDAPPILPMADANLLAQVVDGALFVLRAGRTQHSLVQKAIDALGRERILGVVLNGVEEHGLADYPHYSYDRGASPDPERT